MDKKDQIFPDGTGLSRVERQAFERAVARATEQATQNVSQVHRRRLVWHSALATAAVMAALGAVILFGVSNSTTNEQRSNARFNCTLFSDVANIMSGFIKSDATLRAGQALDQKQIAALRPGALKKLFTDPQTTKLSRRSQTLDKNTTHYWEHTLVPQLQQLANVNCTQRIR